MRKLNPKKTTSDHELNTFFAKLTGKMARGAKEHGYKIPAMEKLIDEIEDELLDVCGWGYLLFQKLEKTREKVKQLVARDRLELTSSEGVFLNPYLTPKAKRELRKKYPERNFKTLLVPKRAATKARKIIGKVVSKNKIVICGHDESVKPVFQIKFKVGEEVMIKSRRQLLKEFGKGAVVGVAFGKDSRVIFSDAEKFCGKKATITGYSYNSRWFIKGYAWSFPQDAFIKIRQEKNLPRAKSICADSAK